MNSNAHQYYDISVTAYRQASVHEEIKLLHDDSNTCDACTHTCVGCDTCTSDTANTFGAAGVANISGTAGAAAGAAADADCIPVVLIHAFPIDRRMWDNCASYMMHYLDNHDYLDARELACYGVASHNAVFDSAESSDEDSCDAKPSDAEPFNVAINVANDNKAVHNDVDQAGCQVLRESHTSQKLHTLHNVYSSQHNMHTSHKLADNHIIFTFEMPGAGRTPIPDTLSSGAVAEDGAYTEAMDRLAETYVAALHKLGYSRAIWVGISMGGYVALALHRLFPQAVAGLALCDTRAEADSVEARANRLRIAYECEHGAGVQPVMHFVEAGPHDSDIKRSDAFITMFSDWIHDQDPRGIAWRQRMAAGRHDETGHLKDIHIPVAVITGELDPSSPPEVMQSIADAIDCARFTVIDQAGHFSCVERPQIVARELAEFVKDVEQVQG